MSINLKCSKCDFTAHVDMRRGCAPTQKEYDSAAKMLGLTLVDGSYICKKCLQPVSQGQEEINDQAQKRQALVMLKGALDFAGINVDNLILENKDIVTILYHNGYTKQVNIACDSVLAMLQDVLEKV